MKDGQFLSSWPPRALLLLILLLSPSLAEAKPFRLNAHSAVLLDMTTGRILYEQNADAPIQPASITKILTLFIVFEAMEAGLVHPTDDVVISRKAAATGGSRMHLRAGKTVPMEDLIKGMAIFSGNDACVAVAEHLCGSVEAFVRIMNHKARELGLVNTHFMNPNGLPAKGQITTARDMARLSAAYLYRFPESLRIHSMRSYTFNKVSQHNRNRLLGKCPGVDGIKTGFVCAAGYHLSATAERGNTRLLAVVLGAPNPSVRTIETTKLIEAGFRMVNSGSPAILLAEDPKPVSKARTAKAAQPSKTSNSRAPAGKSKTVKTANTGQKVSKASNTQQSVKKSSAAKAAKSSKASTSSSSSKASTSKKNTQGAKGAPQTEKASQPTKPQQAVSNTRKTPSSPPVKVEQKTANSAPASGDETVKAREATASKIVKPLPKPTQAQKGTAAKPAEETGRVKETDRNAVSSTSAKRGLTTKPIPKAEVSRDKKG